MLRWYGIDVERSRAIDAFSSTSTLTRKKVKKKPHKTEQTQKSRKTQKKVGCHQRLRKGEEGEALKLLKSGRQPTCQCAGMSRWADGQMDGRMDGRIES